MDSTNEAVTYSGDLVLPKPSPRPPREDSPLAVLVGDQIIYFASTDRRGASGPLCVAWHKKKRCTRAVNGHQHGCDGHHERYDIDGMYAKVCVYVPVDVDHFVKQRCIEHLDSDASDVLAPTWELFDPARHTDVMRHHNPRKWTPDGTSRASGPRPSD